MFDGLVVRLLQVLQESVSVALIPRSGGWSKGERERVRVRERIVNAANVHIHAINMLKCTKI